ncbi:putative transcriptional regulator [Frankia canadensis]|uniref:Putative transcriptional regulator n=1 Tax=Frankia canadensis TaxID=1836972 RepID=A0A2I2KLC1_9ACTN|nr:putative transcriptional regulator [Frankia canadensis]SOU53760.1 putative transcriptional regulator [Frankia canadensis]
MAMAMANLQAEVDDAVVRLRQAGTDLQSIEVKAAAGGLPKSIADTLSAFANARGGLVILGLDEARGFQPVGIDAAKLASDLAAACVDQLEPAVRSDIDIVSVDGQSVVAARIDEMAVDRKPCHVRARGLERGSYLRTHDGDRPLSTYEVHILVSSRGQPRDDMVPVLEASPADLDADLVTSLVRRLRATRGPLFSGSSDDEVLRLLRVLIDTEDGPKPSLAGLLALGRYPQRYYPQLDVTFVAYPTITGEPIQGGTRFLDNQSIDGAIPIMVSMALAAVRRNMKRRAIIVGIGRLDQWEYPEEAIREAVANALMHRDYHPLAQGTQIRVELYPDRLVVTSPGGLHGPVSREDLLAEPASSSRNALLAKLLEDVEVPGTGRTVCENRGTGLPAMAAALRSAGMEPPALIDTVREFRVVFHSHSLLDDDSVAWLSTVDTAGLADRQRFGLAFLYRNTTITNQQYRGLTGCDAGTASRDLTGMAAAGLVTKNGDRRWTQWRLAEGLIPDRRVSDHGAESRRGQAALWPTSSSAGAAVARPAGRRDRSADIRVLLAGGPRDTNEIANALGMTPQGALRWLHRMAEVVRIEPGPGQRRLRWTLRD